MLLEEKPGIIIHRDSELGSNLVAISLKNRCSNLSVNDQNFITR